MAMLTPMSSKTRTSSKSEKPRLSLPTGDITVNVLAAGYPVGAIRNDIVGTMVAGTLVNIRFAPWVGRHILLQIRTIPAIDAGGFLVERLKTLLRRRIASDVKPEGIERRAETFDLRFGRLGRGLLALPDVLRQHQSREQHDDGGHDDQLDE